MLRLVKCGLCNVRYSYVSSGIGKVMSCCVQYGIGDAQLG